jgi:hypothetical protein
VPRPTFPAASSDDLGKVTMRVQFIELHEQAVLPPTIRDEVMDAMQFGLRLLRIYDKVTPVILNLAESTRSARIVDLCSGGGGPWFDLAHKLDKKGIRQILLTDKFPNRDVSRQLRSEQQLGNIAFYGESVDALDIPDDLSGLRTMFSAFHHFQPDDARAILQEAVDASEGICIFEVSRRSLLTIALMVPWALMAFLFTPWVRPFRWSRLLWTYIVPIIPFILLFDGVVSCLRTYKPDELRDMINSLRGGKYRWRMEQIKSRLLPAATFCLTGCPDTRR